MAAPISKVSRQQGRSRQLLSGPTPIRCRAQVQHWQRLDYKTDRRHPGSAFGEFSKIWSYQSGQNMAAFSVDYPFPGWHDLTVCYAGQGWAKDEQVICQPASADGVDEDGYVAVRFTKPGYRSGYLLFCNVNKDGSPLSPRLGADYFSMRRLEEDFRRRWYRLLGTSNPTPPADPAAPFYQLQLFVESYTPLSAADRASAEALFLEGRRTLRKQWAATALDQNRFNELFTYSRLKTTH